MNFNHYDFDVNPPVSSSTRGSGVQASNDNRCPCCDSSDWCFILSNGNAVTCGRTDVAPDGWQQTGTAKDGRKIYTKIGTGKGDRRYKGILPSPNSIALESHPRSDFPQWVEIGGGELQTRFEYSDPATGEPVGRVERKQYSDRRRAYNNGKDTKQIRPHHWVKPHHPDQGNQGWWSDRGKGLTTWPLYREGEVRDAIASNLCNILFYGTGEQSVESYRRLGLYSNCAQGGEGTGDRQVIDFLKRNTPRVFVIAPDEDESGHKAAAKLQEGCNKALLPAVTINLKNVWSSLPPKGDITDILTGSGMSDSEIVKRLELEIRRAIAARLEHERKLNDPDERLKLDLQSLLAEPDPIKKARRKAEICSFYRLGGAVVQELLNYLDGQTRAVQSQCLGLDELFDLPQTGTDYLIPGMLPVGDTVLLVADPKTGKSLLAYDAAFAVATGEDTFLGEACKRGKVLIIQTDEPVGTAKGRLAKRGFRREDAPNVRFMHSFNISQLGELERELEDFRPSLVMIDSLRRISAGREISENSAEFADLIYKLKEIITRYAASGILVHHSNKNPDAVGVGRVRGSSAIAGAVWGVWQLDHIPKPDPNNKKKLIIDPKDPNRIFSVIARDVEGQRLNIELDPENNHWLNHGEDGASESEAQERKTHEARIIDLLKPIAPTGLEAQEINEHLGIGRGIYSVLNRLLGKRLIGSRPSVTDRRRTVYFYPKDFDKNGGGDSPPPPCVEIVIECPESLGEHSVERSITGRSQVDHNRSQNNAIKGTVISSNPEPASITEVDHKSATQGGGERGC